MNQMDQVKKKIDNLDKKKSFFKMEKRRSLILNQLNTKR